MKYMGSKNRIAKHIVPILKENRHKGQPYVEPFVGGANLMNKMDGWRIGADVHEYLIAFWQAFVLGWMPPAEFTEEQYKHVRENRDENKPLTGYVGFCLSYAGKWFGGWCRDSKGKRNYVDEAYRHMMKQRPDVVGVQFVHSSYDKLVLPENSLVYCDPPYAQTTKYKDDFDHEAFWHWVVRTANAGHTVFVSEYDAPDFADCVWEKELVSSLTQDTGSKRAVERLFKIVASDKLPEVPDAPELEPVSFFDGMLSHNEIMDSIIVRTTPDEQAEVPAEPTETSDDPEPTAPVVDAPVEKEAVVLKPKPVRIALPKPRR